MVEACPTFTDDVKARILAMLPETSNGATLTTDP
jgi:hypothetical protein